MGISSIRHHYTRLTAFLKQHRWLSWLLQLCLIVLVFVAVRGYQLRDAVQGEAPIIHGQLLNGETFNLSNYRGQPVLVHFWATWCPVCKMENSNIAAIAQERRVITVASWSEGAQAVAEYMRQENLDMPVLVDDEGRWARVYGVNAVPSSFILDENGMIQFVESGYTTEIGLRWRLWWLTLQ